MHVPADRGMGDMPWPPMISCEIWFSLLLLLVLSSRGNRQVPPVMAAEQVRSLKSTSMSLSDMQAGDWSARLMRLRSLPAAPEEESSIDCLSASYANLSVDVCMYVQYEPKNRRKKENKMSFLNTVDRGC